jgi:hypothetical protein
MLVPAEEMEWTVLSFWGTLPQAASECFVKWLTGVETAVYPVSS